jgi:hypothetical protein
MLLDVDTVGNHPREILDVVAAATAHPRGECRNAVRAGPPGHARVRGGQLPAS